MLAGIRIAFGNLGSDLNQAAVFEFADGGGGGFGEFDQFLQRQLAPLLDDVPDFLLSLGQLRKFAGRWQRADKQAFAPAGFLLAHGFRQNAEAREKEIIEGSKNSNISDLSKLLYLEVIDASFSIDGVIGAFAFTFFIPLIVLGNGLGAIIVREVTVRNIENVKKYVFLKNGAMYSIFFLGIVMLLEAFGVAVPAYVSPLATFACIGFFFWKSRRELQGAKAAGPA